MTTFGDLLRQAAEQGATFDVLEAGTYVAKIIESEYKQSSNGKPQIKTRWEVMVGPKAGFKGLWNYFTLTVDSPQAMAIFYRQMVALGVTNEFLGTLANVAPETAMKQIAMVLQDKAAQIKVIVDKEYNNNKIDRINPLPIDMVAGLPGAGQATVPANPFGNSVSAPQPAPVAPPAPASAPVAQAPAPEAAPVPQETPEAAPPPASLPAPPF